MFYQIRNGKSDVTDTNNIIDRPNLIFNTADIPHLFEVVTLKFSNLSYELKDQIFGFHLILFGQNHNEWISSERFVENKQNISSPRHVLHKWSIYYLFTDSKRLPNALKSFYDIP